MGFRTCHRNFGRFGERAAGAQPSLHRRGLPYTVRQSIRYTVPGIRRIVPQRIIENVLYLKAMDDVGHVSPPPPGTSSETILTGIFPVLNDHQGRRLEKGPY